MSYHRLLEIRRGRLCNSSPRRIHTPDCSTVECLHKVYTGSTHTLTLVLFPMRANKHILMLVLFGALHGMDEKSRCGLDVSDSILSSSSGEDLY